MKMKFALAASALVFGILPITSNASVDIYLDNNTSSYGTASVNFSGCSSRMSGGVVQPHQQGYKIPGSVFDTFCLFGSCEAKVWATDHCGDDKDLIAVIEIDPDNGVVGIDNRSKDYNISANGNKVSITEVNGFKSWFKSLFS